MAWSYTRDESTGFNTKVPEGDHRIRIKSAEKAVSKSGSDMLALQFEVSNYKDAIIYHYIVFLQDRPEITNRNLTQFFDAFPGIQDGDFNLDHYVGKVGAAHVKHEEYNGSTNAKIQYFIKADKQQGLPAWVEPGNAAASIKSDANGFMDIPAGTDEELPF